MGRHKRERQRGRPLAHGRPGIDLGQHRRPAPASPWSSDREGTSARHNRSPERVEPSEGVTVPRFDVSIGTRHRTVRFELGDEYLSNTTCDRHDVGERGRWEITNRRPSIMATRTSNTPTIPSTIAHLCSPIVPPRSHVRWGSRCSPHPIHNSFDYLPQWYWP